ncbi:MBL fold hydrolase [Rhodobacteraceae bacterium WD3A24]|nr:MBL fold hydrolase [Rhodobacteraceae bacterium WD3A24]
MSKERLIYLPLGGAGEVGMNAYVYGYGPAGKERLILVDLGLTFPDMDTTPGVDLIMPDIAWLEARKHLLDAIVITHAHEDHVGALGYLWTKLRAPVFARDFTARIARLKMEEQGLDPMVVNTVAARPETVEAGPFAIQFVPVSHSLPEASALVIDSPAGRLVHTGDFKLDPTPGVGEPWDRAAWAAVGDEGVKTIVCDSTNVFSPHPGRSEASLPEAITALMQSAPGMVVGTTFASNVARVKTMAEAGRAAGRKVCLLGRAMQRMVAVAQESGVLGEFPATIPPEEAAGLSRDEVLLIVTGSQGERRAASAQLARGKYNGLELTAGDTFLFSSKTIPGNERGVLRVVNQFSALGVDVVSDETDKYHVSGHANRPDLDVFQELLKAPMLLPMHGEHRHLREHVRIARARGQASEIVTNGMMVDITGDTPKVIEHVESGRTYLDGSVLIGALDGVVRDRIRLALGGHVTVTVIVDENDEPLGEAWAELMGLPETGRSGAALIERIEAELTRLIEGAGRKLMRDDDKLNQTLRRAARQVCLEEIGKKPEVTVVVSRLLDE